MTSRIVLVRHGESEWNRSGRWQGQSGVGLTDAGHAQAGATAAHLVERYPDIRLIARSDLQRVAQTSAPLQARLAVPVLVDRRLRELDVGTWSGATHAEVAAGDGRTLASFHEGADVPAGGAERISDLRRRVGHSLSDVVGWLERMYGGTAVLLTHGWTARVATAVLTGLESGREREVRPLGNCGLVELVADASGFTVTAHDQHDHLASAGVPVTRSGVARA